MTLVAANIKLSYFILKHETLFNKASMTQVLLCYLSKGCISKTIAGILHRGINALLLSVFFYMKRLLSA